VRILLSADTVGGVWDYSVTMAEGLLERGHSVLLAVLGSPESVEGRTIPPGVEVTCGNFRLEWMPGADADLRRGAEWLAAQGRGWGADLVHLNQMVYSALGIDLPTVVVAHSDVLSWFTETKGSSAGPEWAAYAARVRAGLLEAHAVVAPSRYQAMLLERHYGRGADRVIHNGAPAPPLGVGRARERLVVSAGRAWDPAKGMDLLDRALLAMGGDVPSARLFGSTEGPGGERFTARALRCEGSVPADVLGEWLSRAGVYVAASRYEPFGLAPLEAALRGCPLVLSDIGSFRELWDGCATFFRNGSSESLSAVLYAALAEPERMHEQARAARERALHRYSAAGMVDQYTELYRDAVDTTLAPALPSER
jgi:glycogen synthase